MSDDDEAPDSSVVTPVQTQSMQKAPIWASRCRGFAEQLKLAVGRWRLERDGLDDALDKVETAAITRRMAEAASLQIELLTLANALDTWPSKDPSLSERQDVKARLVTAEDAAHVLLARRGWNDDDEE